MNIRAVTTDTLLWEIIMRRFCSGLLIVAALSLLVFKPGPTSAQQFMYMGPFGPVCMGPLGPGNCYDIERFLRQNAQNAWNDITRGPGQNNWVAGQNGPVQQRMGDIHRGLNDINRGRAPGPAILGTVGGKRICFPYC